MARNVAIIVMVVVMTGDGGGGAACGLETYVAIVKDVRQDRASKLGRMTRWKTKKLEIEKESEGGRAVSGLCIRDCNLAVGTGYG